MNFPKPQPKDDQEFVKQEMARHSVSSLDQLKNFKVVFDSETGEPSHLEPDPLRGRQ